MQEEPPGSMSKSTQNTESNEPSTIVEEVTATAMEVRVLPAPIGEGTSKAVEAAGKEPVVVIFQELPPTVIG